ncbi:MAG TPA: YdgA family protein [Thermodesulfobacteriota bacterium]|nr:YdgA family protein [Thermodesulfobacteriota bacterium]
MRVILIFVALIVLAVVGTTYWFGVEAEKTYKNIQEGLSQYGNVEIIKRKYNRGWFSSEAETELGIRVGTKKIASLILNDRISHGPIPIRELIGRDSRLKPVQAIINSTIRTIPGTGNELTDLLAEMPPPQIKTTVEIKGHGESLISMPPFAHQDREGNGSIKWQGVYGSAKFSPNFRQITTDIKSPGLELTSDEFELSIKGIEFDSQLRSHVPDLYNPTGDMNLTIGNVNVENRKPQERYSIEQLKLYGGTELTGDNLVAKSTFSFENLNTGAENYGPGYYEIIIRNIDPSAWAKLQKMLRETQGMDTSNETERDLLIGKIIDILPDLIKNSPEVELAKLSLKTDKGEASGRAKVTIDGSNPKIAKIPFLLLMSVKAEAGFTIPEALTESILQNLARKNLLEKIEDLDEVPKGEDINELSKAAASEQVKKLIEQKILIPEGENLKLDASYERGVFKLNGQPMETPFSG